MLATDATPTCACSALPADGARSRIVIPQHGLGWILAVWAAAAVPMGVLSWAVAPALASHLSGDQPFTRALLVCLTAGLVWQFGLVLILVALEQRSLRWSVLRDALWLRPPRSPRTGRVGGRTWLVLVPLIAAVAVKELIPGIAPPASRDLGELLGSPAGKAFLQGSWVWLGVLVVMQIFNTVLGEELLFRGFLLPRMNGACGCFDWVVNGVLFAAYHLHVPWMMPKVLLDTLILAYPSRRYRSAWIGIAVHSAQSVFFIVMALMLVFSG